MQTAAHIVLLVRVYLQMPRNFALCNIREKSSKKTVRGKIILGFFFWLKVFCFRVKVIVNVRVIL